MEAITHTSKNKKQSDASGKSPYNSQFVTKIKKSKKNFSEGKYRTIKVEDLWK